MISNKDLAIRIAGSPKWLDFARHRIKAAIDNEHTLFVGCHRYKHIRGGLWFVYSCSMLGICPSLGACNA